MSHAIQVPDDLYAKICAYAQRQGHDPNAVIMAWLKLAGEQAPSVATHVPRRLELGDSDPLAELAGIINIADASAGGAHDAYFGYDEA